MIGTDDLYCAVVSARQAEARQRAARLRHRHTTPEWQLQAQACDTVTTAQGGDSMDSTTALARFEAALTDQVTLVGEDPALEVASRSLVAALRPAARELALDLAEQAAAEVAAQLPEHEVTVVLQSSEPVLTVRPRPGAAHPPPEPDESYEARVTLRLPPSLKRLVEDAASTAGDSVNSWVVDALSGAARRSHGGGRPGRRVQGRVRT